LQDVGTGEEHKYKKSIALSNAFKKKISHPHSGIIYPSNASKFYGVNFALNPIWLDKLKDPIFHAFRLKVHKIYDEFDIVTEIVGAANHKDGDGNFHFVDTSNRQNFLRLNSAFFESFEATFEEQKRSLPSGDFFRRFYHPPQIFV
jgi:hypothetical protein